MRVGRATGIGGLARRLETFLSRTGSALTSSEDFMMTRRLGDIVVTGALVEDPDLRDHLLKGLYEAQLSS